MTPARPPHPKPTTAARLLLVALAGGLGACSDINVEGAGAVVQDAVGTDTIGGFDVPPIQDVTTTPDIDLGPELPGSQFEDEDVPAEAGAAAADSAAPKADPTYLVPGAVAAKQHLVLSGQTAAWVQQDAGGTTLRYWDFGAGADPVALKAKYLTAPRQLALSDGWLFYVDEPFAGGDADVFAVRLATGKWQAVVTQPGAQQHPTASGGLVAWEDCRSCMEGAGQGPTPDIYRRDMQAGTPEEQLTADPLPDVAPTFGTLADGTTALAWVRDGTTARVVGAAVDTDVPLPNPVASVSLTAGFLAYRPSPAIINPDSMMPVDVWVTEIVTGETRLASEHSELLAGLPGTPVAAEGLLAWLESIPSGLAQSLRRVRAVTAADPDVEVALAEEVGITKVSLGDGWLGFVAPRDDNDGLTDVWLLEL